MRNAYDAAHLIPVEENVRPMEVAVDELSARQVDSTKLRNKLFIAVDDVADLGRGTMQVRDAARELVYLVGRQVAFWPYIESGVELNEVDQLSASVTVGRSASFPETNSWM
jgi:hypothetical protein